MRLPDINAQRCTGCGRCVAACPLHLLSLRAQGWEKFAVLHAPHPCTGCSQCELKCPFNAITMRDPAKAGCATGADAQAVAPAARPDEPEHCEHRSQ